MLLLSTRHQPPAYFLCGRSKRQRRARDGTSTAVAVGVAWLLMRSRATPSDQQALDCEMVYFMIMVLVFFFFLVEYKKHAAGVFQIMG